MCASQVNQDFEEESAEQRSAVSRPLYYVVVKGLGVFIIKFPKSLGNNTSGSDTGVCETCLIINSNKVVVNSQCCRLIW